MEIKYLFLQKLQPNLYFTYWRLIVYINAIKSLAISACSSNQHANEGTNGYMQLIL